MVTPLETILQDPRQSPQPARVKQESPILRQKSFQKLMQNSGKLRQEVEKVIYDVRSHDRLITAGWSDSIDVPLNIYLVADLKDPEAAGFLLPLSILLDGLVREANLCQVHLLLNTAVFPRQTKDEKSPDQDVEIYSFLLELDELLQDKSELRKLIPSTPAWDGEAPINPTVYLFDRNKPGTYVVRDNDQMGIMVGNALLALLQDNLAKRLQASNDDFEIADRKSFYNSIGAVALVSDPQSLQIACARRLSRQFLDEYLLAETADVQTAAKEAQQLQDDLGGLPGWLGQVTSHLPPAIGQVNILTATNELAILLTDLKLSEIDYEQVPGTPWAQEFRDYLVRYRSDTSPLVSTALRKNAQQMLEVFSGKISALMDCLPAKPHLYPGGIQNAIRTLEFLTAYLGQQTGLVKDVQTLLKNKKTKVEHELEHKLDQIQDIFEAAPKLIWLVRIFPRTIRLELAPFYYAWRYSKELLLVRTLRDECLYLIQAQAAMEMQDQALIHLQKIITQLEGMLTRGQQDYRTLNDQVVAASKQLPVDWPAFPLGQSENGWEEFFRVPLVDLCLADWSFQKWHPDYPKWNDELLSQRGLFQDWRNASPDSIDQCLIEAAMVNYAAIWQTSLEEILRQWATNPEEFHSATPITPSLISQSLAANQPLVRPDFDAIGGGGVSTLHNLALLGRPDWAYFVLPPVRPGVNLPEIVYTGDPFSGLFLRVRRSVPLESLVDMIRAGKTGWENMPEEARRKYKIIHRPGGGGGISSSDTVDPSNPDMIQRTFTWPFKPKGSSVEMTQTIVLNLSKERYAHYHTLPRFSGEWNRYAEVEMPEIRTLAMEFQRLHAAQKWSTYNQALDVLMFVQNCIPYAYDEDTTGYSEWPRYPIESLMDLHGDCEDVAILCAAVIARLGFQVVLLHYPGHIAFGVAGADHLVGEYVMDPKTGKRYFYGEATGKGWHLGKIPPKYRTITPAILPINILIDED